MSAAIWREGEVNRVLNLLRAQLGKPYAIGYKDEKTGDWIVRGKPSIDEAEPDEFDCSGLSRWIIGQGVRTDGTRIVLPHGTRNQIIKCSPVVGDPRPLDLGFADMKKPFREVNHVVIRENDHSVIEARGKQRNRDYEKVIRRPVSAWEAWPGFQGWWRAPGIWGPHIR